MARMPWRYSQQTKIEEALTTLRKCGFSVEANLFAQEISVLKAEIEHLRGKIDS
jgi:transcription initiation factor IIE alpha subunit